jgi:hypothetical protein
MLYDILEYINYNSMQRLINFESLLIIGFFRRNHKFEIYMEVKVTKILFQIIKKATDPLYLTHSNINDLKLLKY